MDKLFGAPMSSVAQTLGVIFIIICAIVGYIALRNPILARMAIRNVPRRRAQTVLIVIGLMLATAIVSSAFSTGDSLSFSIQRSVKDSLRTMDQIVRIDPDAPKWKNQETPERFPATDAERIITTLDSDPDVDAVL